MLLSLLASAWLLGCTTEATPAAKGQDSQPPACTPADDCCRICAASQACGDACISNDNECSQDPGCACDAADVCPDDDTAEDTD